MNYFAHLVLAQPTIESTVGNLLGDFAKGINHKALNEAVTSGLNNHRAVDRFTDSHESILALKQLFSPQRRRFAGIALDVYFDHLLMTHWQQFYSRPLQSVIDSFYQRMLEGQDLMPSLNMRTTTKRMVDYDWFGSYRDIDSIAHALDRIAARLRFENRFDNAIEDIMSNKSIIDESFLEFFPNLESHIRSLALESNKRHCELDPQSF